MLIIAIFAALVALTSAHLHHGRRNAGFRRRSTGIAVEFTQVGPTDVKASVLNTASEATRLYIYGTILDSTLLVPRVTVTKDDKAVDFLGVIVEYSRDDLPEDAFITLGPGESADNIINMPSLYDITGGEYQVSLTSTFAYAPLNSTKIQGDIAFTSNTLTYTIDAATAAAVPKAHEKRIWTTECSDSQEISLRMAIESAQLQAVAAAEAAESGNALRFREFFATTDEFLRRGVATRYTMIAEQLATVNEGEVDKIINCNDFVGICKKSPFTLAYAHSQSGRVAVCPRFYQQQQVSDGCYFESQTATIMHEMSHLMSDTEDYTYGYENVMQLSMLKRIDNADTYSMYADAVDYECDILYVEYFE